MHHVVETILKQNTFTLHLPNFTSIFVFQVLNTIRMSWGQINLALGKRHELQIPKVDPRDVYVHRPPCLSCRNICPLLVTPVTEFPHETHDTCRSGPELSRHSRHGAIPSP